MYQLKWPEFNYSTSATQPLLRKEPVERRGLRAPGYSSINLTGRVADSLTLLPMEGHRGKASGERLAWMT